VPPRPVTASACTNDLFPQDFPIFECMSFERAGRSTEVETGDKETGEMQGSSRVGLIGSRGFWLLTMVSQVSYASMMLSCHRER
jgi:hypothetical protein